MTERRGTKALELWCRRITDGYPGVNVQNMTTSWKDGLAFCAMIHHFRPDLIDFDSLNKDDVYGNNELAFRTAAEHLGIPALLDAEDMASCSVPDRLSILTYLSQFYQCFGGSSPSRLALSRTKESTNEGITPVPESTTPKVGPRLGMRRDACAVCGMPIFLAEKLVISRTAYHRTCFRCARCKNQLTPGNYYETEDGEYCCETCPDEEMKESTAASVTNSFDQQQGSYNEAIFSDEFDGGRSLNESELLERSLSDEEKTVRRRAQFSDEISRVREEPPPPLPPPPTRKGTSINDDDDDDNDDKCFIPKEEIPQSAQTRLSNFINDHLLANNNNEQDSNSEAEDNRRRPKGSSISSKIGVKYVDDVMPCRSSKDRPNSNGLGQHLEIKDFSEFNDSVTDVPTAKSEESVDSNFRLVYNDYDQESSKEGPSSLENGDTSIGEDTKDSIGPAIDASGAAALRPADESSIDEDESLSLVQRRLRMFEIPKYDGTTNVNEARVVARSDTSSIAARDVENEKEADIPPLCPPSIVELTMTTTTKIEEEEKLPPPVPKRSNLRARRDEKSKNNHNDADDGESTEVKVLAGSKIDLSREDNYPEDLNPFASDEEDNRDRREIDSSHQESRNERVSTNPFGSSEDEDERDDSNDVVVTPLPAKRNLAKFIDDSPANIDNNVVSEAPTKRLLKAPHINLNPFWSDEDEEHESDDENETRCHSLNASTPVPRPRTIKQTGDSAFSPSWKYRDTSRGDIYTSNSSLASASSTPGVGTCRKKKPAPLPPAAVKDSCDNSAAGSNNSLSTPRGKKTKAAPPPPLPTSAVPSLVVTGTDFTTVADSSIIHSGKVQPEETRDYEIRRDPKYGKDEANRNKQSMVKVSHDEINPYDAYMDKSAQGKWKRKKGPAPARPTPHRRKIKVMSLKDVKLELDEIEMQQQGLEKQGVRLEQLIRDKAETGNSTQETSLGMDVEELVLELFALVNEKNELFRRQAELMLLRRQQRLEEEHADIEYQIRCLLCQPEATKTDFDKQREETLIQRLVEIVERRNEIVECLEMDRRREIEEDHSINTRMEIYAAKTKSEFAKELEEEAEEKIKLKKSKKTKFKEKAREKIMRKIHKKDADKDVDEAEVKLKRQNKKKWF